MTQPFEFKPVEIQPGSTSFFSEPETALDPSLFDKKERLHPHVREWITETVMEFLGRTWAFPQQWTRLWIAGSGASYQWSADRDPGDLDIMLGLDYIKFRRANRKWAGLSDVEIGREMNVAMFSGLYPEINDVSFGGTNFEVTVYVNPGVNSTHLGIMAINPYAAYDVTDNSWSVWPNKHPQIFVHPGWNITVESDRQRGEHIVNAYVNALAQIRMARNPGARVNGETNLKYALNAAEGLYDEIHAGRKAAFSVAGHGYFDFNNYRWQAGKHTGVVQAMKRMKDYKTSQQTADEMETYGLELPDHETLIRRAGMAYQG